MKKAISLAIALLALASSLYADASFMGVTGGIWNPDETVIGKHDCGLSSSYIDLKFDSLWTINLNYGLIPNLEVGVGYMQLGDLSYSGNNDGKAFFNAKYQILPESKYGVGVAVGINDIGKKLNPNKNSFYAVAGKTFGKENHPFHISAGFGSGVHDGFFTNLDYGFTSHIGIIGEYQSEGSTFNAALRYRDGKGTYIKAGVFDIGGLDSLFLSIGIGF
ncbi:MAG: outer membrane beta-barrel protein [Abditibacteriota bacterium]|nr:outer membrane beta-barrel protein [Abditibacteriota bacterium]